MSTLALFLDLLLDIGKVTGIFGLVLIACFYPPDQDRPLTQAEIEKERQYYAEAYAKERANDSPAPGNEKYVATAKHAAETFDIKGGVARFAVKNKLSDKRVLDVGAGQGYLQDVVENYTGLDISPSAKRFFHKPFVAASATAMPFGDGEFDAAWSIWVLEHVPNPEQALREIRRVVKDGGVLYLYPAWNCHRFLAHGHRVRPFSDFDLQNKFLKAGAHPYLYLRAMAQPFTRGARLATWKLAGGGPVPLQYGRLEANYKEYWEPDSDAVNYLDRYQVALWFTSRGDECLNCAGALGDLASPDDPLEIRLHKKN